MARLARARSSCARRSSREGAAPLLGAWGRDPPVRPVGFRSPAKGCPDGEGRDCAASDRARRGPAGLAPDAPVPLGPPRDASVEDGLLRVGPVGGLGLPRDSGSGLLLAGPEALLLPPAACGPFLALTPAAGGPFLDGRDGALPLPDAAFRSEYSRGLMA